MPKHRLIYEEHYGPIPDGYAVVFKDSDKSNVTIDNLMLISRANLAVINKSIPFTENAEINEVIVANVELIQKIREMGES